MSFLLVAQEVPASGGRVAPGPTEALIDAAAAAAVAAPERLHAGVRAMSLRTESVPSTPTLPNISMSGRSTWRLGGSILVKDGIVSETSSHWQGKYNGDAAQRS